MARRFPIFLTGLTALFVFSNGWAQFPQIENRVERWNDMWMNQTNNGLFGNQNANSVDAAWDPCPPNPWAPQCELPGGSGQQYLFQMSLWIGAKIVEGDIEIPRVSVGTDGWLNPSLAEFWPVDGEGGEFIERSRQEAVDCFGDSIFDPTAQADHIFSTVFADTFADPFFVQPDFDGTLHRPLGLKVRRTTYTDINPLCSHIYWIRYELENIGSNVLRDIYVGHYVEGDVGLSTEMDHHRDDLTGFEPTRQIAYICDNDGRPVNESSGPFSAPHVTGTMFLRLPEDDIERISYNWWVPNGDVGLDYGPAWEAYALRDSLGMGWTDLYGSPMGDQRKYQIMSNGEHDYDQVYANSPDWIATHPQDNHAWALPISGAFTADLANGYDTRYLLSFGPVGNPVGDHRELAPGESFEIWLAYIGGMDFHNSSHPQPTDVTIDPHLFDFSDFDLHAMLARTVDCFPWMGNDGRSRVSVPSRFALDPVFPNPFNSQATIRFHMDRAAEVQVTVYDVLGRTVQELINTPMNAGSHEYSWNASDLPTGLYFIEARTDFGARIVQKAMLLK